MSQKKKLPINPAEKILVKSKSYGEHFRAPRGSKTKLTLSKAMRSHGIRLRKSNIPAKLITDALKPFRENFKGGMLWQKLVKHFAAQAKKGILYSVAGIENWDFNDKYLTSRIMTPDVEVKPIEDNSVLLVKVNYVFSKRFLERKKKITSFRITLIFLFPDFKKNKIITIPHEMPDKPLNDFSLYTFVVQVPRRADSYLVCFKAEPCLNDNLYPNSPNIDMAMSFTNSGVFC